MARTPRVQTARTLAAELIAYLDAHPRAADTAEGIAEWWLSGSGCWDGRPATLAEALETLVAAGRLARIETPDGRLLYAGRTPPAH